MNNKPSQWLSDAAGRLIAGWMRTAHDRPRLTLAATTALCVAAVIAATGLRIDADSSRMLSPELPTQKAAHELNAAFPRLKSAIIITVEASQADLADLAVIHLAEQLRERIATIETVFSPSEDPFMAAHGFLYRDYDTLEDMFNRLSKSANLLAHLRADQSFDGFTKALNEAVLLAKRAEIGPGALERLFAETASVVEAQTLGRSRQFAWSTVLDDEPSGTVTRLIAVTPRLDKTRLSPAKPALADISGVIAAMPAELSAAVAIQVTGEPALRAEELASVTATIGLSLAISLVLVAIILRLGLGHRSRVALALASLIASLIATTGFAAVAIGSLNLISVAFIVLMVGLGIDFAIHVMAHVDEHNRDGALPGDAVVLTGHRAGLALILAALTTAASFLAFAVTEFRGMAQLGVIGSAGVILAFLMSITLIPAVLGLWPRIALEREEISATAATARDTPRWAVWGLLLITAVAVWPAMQVRFDADPIALRDPDTGSVLAFRNLALDPATSPYRASVLVGSAAEADRVAAALEDAPGVSEAINLGDLLPEDQDRKLQLLDIAAASIDHAVAGQPTALTAEEEALEGDPLGRFANELAPLRGMADRLSRALVAYEKVRTPQSDQALQERIFATFPLLMRRLEAMLSAGEVSAASLPAPMRERFLSPSGTYRVEVLPIADLGDASEARAFAAAVSDVAPGASGPPLQLSAAGEIVARAMLIATLLAALMTTILTLLATARFGDAFAVLLPLVVAGVLTAAGSTLLGVPFNYANVIVLPLMIGIGVDSGIHLALRARRAPGAVFATSTPRAVLLSGLTTVAAFGTLTISDHQGTASMGILLTLAISLTLVSVMTLTPTLIAWTSRNRL